MKTSKTTKKDLSRRDFIKTTAVGVGATALAGLGSTEAKTVPPPQNWDEEADVLVIGGGIGGLVTAVEATTQGAQVIVLEKMDVLGGTSLNHGGQFIGYGPTSVQQELKIPLGPEDTRENFYKLLTYGREDVLNLELANLVADHCNEAIEWAISIGHKFASVTNTNRLPFLAPRPWTHNSKDGGYGYTQVLKKNCEDRGVRILMQCRAQQLVANVSGEVLGAKVDVGGQEKYFKAKRAVVLAAGGYCWNPEMQKQFTQRGVGANPYHARPHELGDGIKMGQGAGADLWGMEWAAVYPATVKPMPGEFQPPRVPGAPPPPFYFLNAGSAIPAIWVNKHGYRFVDEALPGSYLVYRATGQEDGIVWVVFDSAAIARSGGKGVSAVFDSDVEKEVAAGYVTKANTILELAQAIGISPAENLVNTVDRYNVGAVNREDSDFGKPSQFVAPIATAPFYATRVGKAALITFGGLKTNVKAEILDTENKPVPRLYGVGRVTGGYMAKWYPTGGSTLGEMTVLGRIAGKNAADEAPWD